MSNWQHFTFLLETKWGSLLQLFHSEGILFLFQFITPVESVIVCRPRREFTDETRCVCVRTVSNGWPLSILNMSYRNDVIRLKITLSLRLHLVSEDDEPDEIKERCKSIICFV